ncbi:MAG: serine hydrolase domain-containing protein [Rhodomicrobiaceae bacterium]
MIERRRFLTAAGAALLAGCAPALALGGEGGRNEAEASPAPVRDSRADRLVEAFSRTTGVRDCSVLVMRGETRLYQRHMGRYGPGTVINIASASKWFAGATAMALVAAGRLRLDAAISAYVPGLPPDYARLRLDQLLSFTAGLPSLKAAVDIRQPRFISLTRSAQLAAREPLASEPGTQFDYGGPNLQFIGAAVEEVTGMRWQAAFDAQIANPLGMRDTLWSRLFWPPRRSALPANPLLQGGAWTSMADYAAFLTMIAQDGRYHGRLVLPPSAVRQMGTVMTKGLRKGYVPPGAAGRPIEYAIAHWCERMTNGRCSFELSPGAFGTYPWVDRTAGLHGLIFLKDRLPRIANAELALRDGLIRLYG